MVKRKRDVSSLGNQKKTGVPKTVPQVFKIKLVVGFSTS